MLAYDKNRLDATSIRRQTAAWQNQGLFSASEQAEVTTAFSGGFYTPNIFIRIGLFVFAVILVVSALGILWVPVLSHLVKDESSAGFTLLLGAALLLAVTENWVIRLKLHYASGLDEALVWIASLFAVSGVCLLLSEGNPDLVWYYACSLPLLVLGAVRYADRVLTFFAFACLVGLLFLLLLKAGNGVVRAMPFVGMIFSAAVYYWVRRNAARTGFRFWAHNLLLLEGLALLSFYASGNYWVVSELNQIYFPPQTPTDSYQLPLGGLFYGFTALVPAAFVGLGLRFRNRPLLRVGLASAALSVATFEHLNGYRNLEITFIVLGAALVLVSYLCIRLLKKSTAFTYKADEEELLPDAEALLTAQTFGGDIPASGGLKFGGGASGGGGAGGNY